MILKIFLAITGTAILSCSNPNKKISTLENRETLELPDGSMAYLNSNSSIEFSTNSNQRQVHQTGEVFYSIVKADLPFIVKTDVGEIRVLGTKFNVNSNNDELEVEVEEGSVELKIEKLVNKIEKGQKAFFKESSDGIIVGDAEFKYKKWMKNFEKELKKAEKHVNKGTKNIEKESRKVERGIKKGIGKIKIQKN